MAEAAAAAAEAEARVAAAAAAGAAVSQRLSTCSKQLAKGCNGTSMMTILVMIMTMSLHRTGGWGCLGVARAGNVDSLVGGRMQARMKAPAHVQAASALGSRSHSCRCRGWSTKWAVATCSCGCGVWGVAATEVV